MIDIQTATKIVLEHRINLTSESVPLAQSVGRVLREQLIADREFPPFHRVAMDGIAIRFSAFETGQRSFPVEGIQAAGSPALTLQDNNNCLEIMTGAVLAKNTDTIIRYEDVSIENNIATITIDTIKKGQNIHIQGTDRQIGDLIIGEEKIISPAEINTAATLGKTHLNVASLPRAAVISTGDELVEVQETPLPYQIRKSNVYAVKTSLEQWGVATEMFHLVDDKADIKTQLAKCLEEFDLVIMSGGVSKGKFDFIPAVLAELQVKKLFHRVRQKPGKPFWFGTAPNGTVVFALPGNPVSTFMCVHRYVRPWLRASLNLAPLAFPKAVLQEDFSFRPDLTYFLQVRISFHEDGTLGAWPIPGKGSGDLANLNDADGFLELPRGQEHFSKGDVFPVLIYRNLYKER